MDKEFHCEVCGISDEHVSGRKYNCSNELVITDVELFICDSCLDLLAVKHLMSITGL